MSLADVPKRIPFILPAAPVLKRNPPTGPQWIHECKFDGWRGQLHKAGDGAVVFSRNGKDLTISFHAIAHSLRVLPARSAVIDCELVACDSDGMPSFSALMAGRHTLCAWCFDLMELNGRDLREQTLARRKEKLRDLLIRADDDVLRYSESFEDHALSFGQGCRLDQDEDGNVACGQSRAAQHAELRSPHGRRRNAVRLVL